MLSTPELFLRAGVAFCVLSLAASSLFAIDVENEATGEMSLNELKRTGLERSRFRPDLSVDWKDDALVSSREALTTDLTRFAETIAPLIEEHCVACHGPDTVEGSLRLDTLNPDIVQGGDADWWAEVLGVLTKQEMPPAEANELDDVDRQILVDWLASELHAASLVRRRSGSASSFRRRTRYEYNYALQDLLGLPFDFAKDLPPEAQSEEGFENSAQLLHISVSQFEMFHKIARAALSRAVVTGDRPVTRYWNIPMSAAAAREWSRQDKQRDELTKNLADDPTKLQKKIDELEATFKTAPGGAYYHDRSTGRFAKAEWRYPGARYAFASEPAPKAIPEIGETVAVLPNGLGPRLIVELGNELPDHGVMRVAVRAAKSTPDVEPFPSLQLYFGWQASNEGRALLRVSDRDQMITAGPEKPEIIQWDVPLGEVYPRNSVRKTSPMGALPSPSEYIRLVNSSATPTTAQIDYVQVAAPVFDEWPPASHRRIFFESEHASDESVYAREVIAKFMSRSWQRPPTTDEVERKVALFHVMRPDCDSFEIAVAEVLATVLSSPQFLYVGPIEGNGSSDTSSESAALGDHALASRLALFLWSSVPDTQLSDLADNGRLTDPDVLRQQVDRMLNDPRIERFAQHFVHQWLDMKLLDFLDIRQNVRGFDPLLKEAMQNEPIALFQEVLRNDESVLDFIHCDYAMLNERLARHYGVKGIYGNHFRRVALTEGFRRGGLLTQAGLLTMNSDWPDSHPLKRAIWMLESVLADPPPPPPPAVPQIDLADPEIAKMTLKERIEDHRNHAACMSCHVKIDPWGIAFEHYDALGRWRNRINGKPVDASSELFNGQTLNGMEGLKRFLLVHRQDQFVRAMVEKIMTYALGRQLAFADRAAIDEVTAQVRQNGDGLRTLITAVIQSELFRSR